MLILILGFYQTRDGTLSATRGWNPESDMYSILLCCMLTGDSAAFGFTIGTGVFPLASFLLPEIRRAALCGTEVQFS